MSDQSHFSRALLNGNLEVPEGLRVWNGSDPATRFAVYRNNVVVSLIDALADTFPVTQALVGVAFFRAMALVFFQNNPVKTRVLTWLGANFADFIETFRPANSLAYLPDMARLEMLRVCSYHAADADPITLEILGLALEDSGGLSNLTMQFHPSAHLIQSRHAVWSLWTAHQKPLGLDTVKPGSPETVLVYRCDGTVELLNLSKAEGFFVDQLMSGASLALTANAAFALDPQFDLVALLGSLIRFQLITSISNQKISP